MKSILFISAALEMSDTSAAIRNRKLLTVLAQTFEVSSIEFCAKNAKRADKLHSINNTIEEMPFKYIKAKESGKNNSGLIKKLIKKYSRCIIPDNYALKYSFMASSLEKIISKSYYDIVIISSDPKGIHFLWFSSPLKRLRNEGALTFQYWGDPWFGDISIYNNFLTSFLEKKIYNESNYIIFNSKATLEEKKKSNVKNDKFLLLERGVNNTAKLPNECTVNIPQEITISYAGDYRYKYRNLNNVCEALKNTAHKLFIVGNGELESEYYSQNNVLIKSRVSYQEANKLTDDSDVVIIVLNSLGNQIPGKIYDLANSKKPIIMIYENQEILNYIPFKDRFILCRNNVNDIVCTIQEISGKSITISYLGVKKNDYQENLLAIFDKDVN